MDDSPSQHESASSLPAIAWTCVALCLALIAIASGIAGALTTTRRHSVEPLRAAVSWDEINRAAERASLK